MGAKITPVLIIACWLATVLGHLEVSLWLVHKRESEWLGPFRYADFLPHAAIVTGLALIAWQVKRAIGGRHHAATLAGWALWLAAAIAFDRLLMFSLPEYLHYPQYALLAGLTAGFIDPDRTRYAFGPVLLAVVLLGIADEVLQYAWITISYSDYLDFNDFVLNLLGGFMGLLLYYGFPREARIQPSKHDLRYGLAGFAALALALLTVAAAIQFADPTRPLAFIERETSYGTWIPGPRSGRYYVLPPAAGTVLLASLGALATAAPVALRTRHSNRPART